MENPYQAPGTDVQAAGAGQPTHRDLPQWIRFFSWIFLAGGPLIVLTSLADLVMGLGGMTYRFFGISARGGLDNPWVVLVIAIFVVNAVAAYGLLWKKEWGLDVGLLAGAIGLLLAVGSLITVIIGAKSGVSVRLEPLFQIAFITVLIQRRKAWLSGDE